MVFFLCILHKRLLKLSECDYVSNVIGKHIRRTPNRSENLGVPCSTDYDYDKTCKISSWKTSLRRIQEATRVYTRLQSEIQSPRLESYCLEGRDSFFPTTINDWNALSASVVDSPSLEIFKTLIREHFKPEHHTKKAHN